MPLVDTHCHLQSQRFAPDFEEVLARTLEALDWIVVIGDDLPSSEEAVALVRERVFATAGIHPYHATGVDAEALATLRGLLGRPGVVALGEIGLDYFNEYSPRPDQAQAFEQQLDMACELGLPVVIHNREADADSFAMLQNFGTRLSGCIMHCFGSGKEFAHQCAEAGFYVSFAGNVTFPKAEALRAAAAAVPLDRLLVETDAPYLAPVPLRGKRCEPWHVQFTAETLAALHGLTPEELGQATSTNAARAYRVPQHGGLGG